MDASMAYLGWGVNGGRSDIRVHRYDRYGFCQVPAHLLGRRLHHSHSLPHHGHSSLPRPILPLPGLCFISLTQWETGSAQKEGQLIPRGYFSTLRW